MIFPAQFMLVAAMNPSPTGSKNGRSTAVETQRYLNKISGPLLDRIDIHVEVSAVKHEILLKQGSGEPSSLIREHINSEDISEAIQYRTLDRQLCVGGEVRN